MPSFLAIVTVTFFLLFYVLLIFGYIGKYHMKHNALNYCTYQNKQIVFWKESFPCSMSFSMHVGFK